MIDSLSSMIATARATNRTPAVVDLTTMDLEQYAAWSDMRRKIEAAKSVRTNPTSTEEEIRAALMGAVMAVVKFYE